MFGRLILKLRLWWNKKKIIAWGEWYLASLDGREVGEEPPLPDDLKEDVKLTLIAYQLPQLVGWVFGETEK